MATQLQIVNKVLRRLREDTVTATTDNAYAGLIAEFVADIHEEMKEAHAWEQTKKTLRVDFVAGQTRYNLSDTVLGSGDVHADYAAAVCNERSQIVTNHAHQPQAFWWRTASTQYGQPMILVNNDERERVRALNTDNVQSVNVWFSLTNDGVNKYMDMMYVPADSTSYCTLTFLTDDAELEADGSTDNTNITIPNRPLYLGALYMALNERGEEIGEPGNIAERRWINALGAAIEADRKHNELTNEYDYYRG